MKKNRSPFFDKIVPVNQRLLDYLKENISGGSLLDIGCGPKAYSTPFKEICSKITTIDAWEKTNPDILADLEKISLLSLVNEKYDFILMIDFIEHLDKTIGKKLIDECKRICNKKIFVLTPLEQIWTDNRENINDKSVWCYGNQYDLHKSIWSEHDFEEWSKITLKKGKGIQNYYIGYYEKK